MTLLDTIAEWVGRVLGVFPPSVATFLSIPVMVLVVASGATLFARRLLVPVGRAIIVVLGWVAVVAGAVVLLPEAAIASIFRQASRRPPAVVYSLGDAVASGVAALGRAVDNAAGTVNRLARTNGLVVILLVGAWIWWWNYNHCPDAAAPSATCVRPIAAWWSQITAK